MNIFAQAQKLGIKIDSHESDMYLPVNQLSTQLVNNYEFKANVTTFRSNIDNALWFDIPFAYEPFWEDAESKIESWVGL